MNLVNLPHPNKYLIVESLDYPNPYDFKVPHRHDYFEIILIKEGIGNQQIDFASTKLQPNSIYTIYPRQIHLLQRNTAQGLLVQFQKNIFEHLFPIQHHQLYFTNPELLLDDRDFQHLYNLVEQILLLNKSPQLTPLSIYKSYSYLQLVLITLIEYKQQNIKTFPNVLPMFLQLISQHIKDKRKVSDYAEILGVSNDKLTTTCKDFLDTTPLKLIHEELLLEIKRLMILNELSLKEIAYELNFDNSANFSNFIKTATALTPSELQQQLLIQLNNSEYF